MFNWIVEKLLLMVAIVQEKVWDWTYEICNDINPDDKERMSGQRKPTRLAKSIRWFCGLGR